MSGTAFVGVGPSPSTPCAHHTGAPPGGVSLPAAVGGWVKGPDIPFFGLGRAGPRVLLVPEPGPSQSDREWAH